MANNKDPKKKPAQAKAASGPATSGGSGGSGSTSNDKALEAAKKKFEDAQKKLQELKQKMAKDKRTVATAEKKKEALKKKIQDTKDASSKAVEMLTKKAEELLAKAAELEPEAEKLATEAEGIDTDMSELNEELEVAKEESKEQLKALGISTGKRTGGASADATTRRARNNFMYKLKTKDWTMVYDVRNRITHAKKDGIEIEFLPEVWIATTPDGAKHENEYGQGSLIEVAKLVKDTEGEGAGEAGK